MTNEIVQEPQNVSSRYRPVRRRHWFWVLLFVVGSMALLGAGWLIAGLFQSPAQSEAGSRPPAPGAITSAVVEGQLETIVTARAQIERNSSETVSLPAIGKMSVVTKATTSAGASIGAGHVLAEIDGRPVFAIPGNFSFYRDMTVGMKGPDVAQLQVGLNAAGYSVTADGRFGQETAYAVEAMYRDNGYDTPTATAATPTTPEAPAAPATQQLSLPSSEFLVLKQVPAFVVDVPSVGTPISEGTSITVEGGAVIASASVTSSVASQLKTGMAVTLTGADGQKAKGVIRTIDPAPSDNSTSSDTSKKGKQDLVVIESAGESSIPDAWLRQDVLAEITVELVAQRGLIVPASAVAAGVDGMSHVYKQMDHGTFREIKVTEVAVLDGRSAITPADPTELKSGDLVRIG